MMFGNKNLSSQSYLSLNYSFNFCTKNNHTKCRGFFIAFKTNSHNKKIQNVNDAVIFNFIYISYSF